MKPTFPAPAADPMSTTVLATDHPAEARAAVDAPYTPPARELARRSGDGATVVLLWRPGDDGVIVDVTDARTGQAFHLAVPGANAWEAFSNPFAYVPRA